MPSTDHIAPALMEIAPYAAKARWNQNYDSFGQWQRSTLRAVVPLRALLVVMKGMRRRSPRAELISLRCALLIALRVFHVPTRLIAASTLFGVGYGIFLIYCILLPILFMHRLTARGVSIRSNSLLWASLKMSAPWLVVETADPQLRTLDNREGQALS